MGWISCTTNRVQSKNISTDTRSAILSKARKQVGSRYQYGARGPKAYDCSGLVSYLYAEYNPSMKGSADHMSQYGKAIKLDKGRPGDLLFFKRNNSVFHVSIISKISKNGLWVIHSTSSRGVIEQDIMSSSYWKPMIYKIISLESIKN